MPKATAMDVAAMEVAAARGEAREGDLQKKDILRRLRTVAGHIKGVEKMIERDARPSEILKQVSAVRAALAKIALALGVKQIHLSMVAIDDSVGRDQQIKELEVVLHNLK